MYVVHGSNLMVSMFLPWTLPWIVHVLSFSRSNHGFSILHLANKSITGEVQRSYLSLSINSSQIVTKIWKYITCKERTYHLVRNIATFCVHTEAIYKDRCMLLLYKLSFINTIIRVTTRGTESSREKKQST